MVIFSRGWPGMLEVPSLFLHRSHARSMVSSWLDPRTAAIWLGHVWTSPSFLRCQRDQACVLDPATSADAQLPAELECGADRLAPGGPLRCQGWRAQPRHAAMGTRPVLGQGPQRRLRQY